MASQTDGRDRRLVPRWRYSHRTTHHTAEHAGDPRTRKQPVSCRSDANEIAENWRQSPSIAAAADVVAAAIAFGTPNIAKDAARFITANQVRATNDVVQLARLVLQEPSEVCVDTEGQAEKLGQCAQEARQVIHTARVRLTDSPRNVSYRLDLALGYAVLGLSSKAWTEMSRAIALYPNHRNVLRAAVRLLVHIGRADQAYEMVRRHPRTQSDPWIMSLELTLASILEKPVKHGLRARRLVETLQHMPGFISELASAAGMLEWRGGHHKRGRKMLQLSLVDPTDNVIAQAQWATKEQIHSLEVPRAALQLPGTMEANYLCAMAEARWEDALENLSAWKMDEPFSSRPAVAGSFVASALLDDHERAVLFARSGLQADGEDQLLRNNYVVALARAGNVKQAKAEFRKIQRPLQASYPEFAFLATEGLLKFANADAEGGRKLYRQAADLASGVNRQLVMVHWLDTEERYSPSTADFIVEPGTNALRKSTNLIVSTMATKTRERHDKRRQTTSNGKVREKVSSLLLKLIKEKSTR